MSTDNKQSTTDIGRQHPIKITYLVDFFRTVHAGTEKQLGHLLTQLPGLGFEVQLISLQDSPFIKSEVRYTFPNVSIMSLGAESDISRSLRIIPKLFRELRASTPDIVHTFFPTSNSLGAILARAAGVKTVITSRRDMGFNLTWRDVAALRFANFFVACIVANCEAVCQKTIILEHVPAQKVCVIYNGINLNGSYKGRSATGKKSPVVGIVANLNRPVKRVDLFIKAAAKIHRRFPDVAFWILGDGELREELEKEATDLGLKSSIVFWGRQTDVRSYISQMDIGVICSDSEGFSNAIMEYMEVGLPVIATSSGGNPELVRDGENGLLVPPDSEASLSKAMLALLLDPTLAREMGIVSRKTIESGFSVAGMVEKTRGLYARYSEPHKKSLPNRI